MGNMLLGIVIAATGVVLGLMIELGWATVINVSAGVGLFSYGLHEWYAKKGWVK